MFAFGDTQHLELCGIVDGCVSCGMLMYCGTMTVQIPETLYAHNNYRTKASKIGVSACHKDV